jgi:carbamoyl-phosphate synthase small subunit
MAILALADGTVFRGVSIGAPVVRTGEVVFNTSLTGYQEILTDPSYSQQIVTLTYPHIGNTGMNSEDVESDAIHAAGLIIKDLPVRTSNWRSQQSLSEALTAAGIPGIAGIDTRRLTRRLRERGAQAGCLIARPSAGEAATSVYQAANSSDVQQSDDQMVAEALERARAFDGLAGMDLAKVVSVKQPYAWTERSWRLVGGYGTNEGSNDWPHAGSDASGQAGDQAGSGARRPHVVAFDFGIKRNILRMLADRDARITVVPAQTSAAEVIALSPDGIFLSNGPGDPEPCDYAIRATAELVERGYPTFGICLGHQILGLASGARTLKMKFGHHGANHPVKDLDDHRVLITSQNHGFAVDPATLPAHLRVTHVSLFDGSIQGLARTDRPAFGFQGHPEASPGPHDVAYLFDRFFALMGS